MGPGPRGAEIYHFGPRRGLRPSLRWGKNCIPFRPEMLILPMFFLFLLILGPRLGRPRPGPSLASEVHNVPRSPWPDSRNWNMSKWPKAFFLSGQKKWLSYRDSLYRDSLYRDSLYRESLYRDSLYKDSLYRESLNRESLYRESYIADSYVGNVQNLVYY